MENQLIFNHSEYLFIDRAERDPSRSMKYARDNDGLTPLIFRKTRTDARPC